MNFPSIAMIAKKTSGNVLTNYIRIAADVLNLVFKGNAPYQTFTSTQLTVHHKLLKYLS